MKNFKKGDYIFNTTKKTNHFVDCVETHGNVTVVFTEDSQCFHIDEVVAAYKSVIAQLFCKLFSKQSLTSDEEVQLENSLINAKPIKFVDITMEEVREKLRNQVN